MFGAWNEAMFCGNEGEEASCIWRVGRCKVVLIDVLIYGVYWMVVAHLMACPCPGLLVYVLPLLSTSPSVFLF